MKDFLPYIVSVITALLSFFGALLVNRKNSKAEIEKMKLEHKQIMERNKQEQDARIAQLEKEYELKMGAQMITSLTDKAAEAVCSSTAVKNEINKKANQAFVRKKGKRK